MSLKLDQQLVSNNNNVQRFQQLKDRLKKTIYMHANRYRGHA